MSVFVVGSGGFGGPRTSDACIAAADKMPLRKADVTKEFKTSIDQVLGSNPSFRTTENVWKPGIQMGAVAHQDKWCLRFEGCTKQWNIYE